MTKLVLRNIGSLLKIILIIIFASLILRPGISYSQQIDIEDFRNAYRRMGYNESQIMQMLKNFGYITDEEELLLEKPKEISGTAILDSLIKYQELVKQLQQELIGKLDTVEIAEEEIKPFGYEFFNWMPTSFEPPAFGSVAPDYVIGPGDVIKVEMWGQTIMNKTFTVDREGGIFMDEVGKITVIGLTFEQAKDKITNRLKNIYSKASVDVSMGVLRSIQVWVVGRVKVPGGYWLTSLSPALAALYFAGGATENGSLRNIELHQSNTTKIIDLYEFILKAELNENLRLRDGDRIRVPPVGKRVAITGEIKVPAIYELKPDEVLEDLINIAGGFEAGAYLKMIQIWRIIPPEQRILGENDRKLMDVNFLNEKEKRTGLFDGDSIQVHPISNSIDNYVEVVGFAKRPGLYTYSNNMTLKELLRLCEGVLDEAYLERGEIIRSNHDTAVSLIEFDLIKLLDNNNFAGDNDIVLNKKDVIKIYSKWEITEKDSVDIYGAVKNPGRYELFKDMTLNDIIFQVGGLKESAYKHRAEISRVRSSENIDEGIVSTFSIELNPKSSENGFKLKRFDNVFIREDPNWMLQRNVQILGEIMMPGVYSIKSKNERLSNLIERAGGLKNTAYPEGISFYRKKNDIGVIDVDLMNILKNKNDPNNLILADGDSIYIPEIINTVRIEGAVNLPRSVLYQEGKGIDYYIRAAGGYKETADKKRTSIMLANGRITNPKRFWFDPKITAGSTIFVPIRPEGSNIGWGDAIVKGAQIFSGIVTSIFILDRIINQ